MLIAIVVLLFSTTTFAHDFEVDGIYYNYLDQSAKTVSVTYKGDSYSSYSNEYTGAISIPASVTYNGFTYSVTLIDSEAFEFCNELTEITIPNSVTSIGNYVFYSCSSLTKVTIGNSVTSIGNYAFYKCSGLISVTIPNSVTTIGYDAFSGCTELNEVNYNAENCTISYPLFGGCSNLKTLNLGNEVKTIPSYAFKYCNDLTKVTIGNSVTSIGNSAFYGCTSLTEVNIPNSVTSIDNYTFYSCTGLTKITIGNSVTSIGDNTFIGCDNLKLVINLSNLTLNKGSSDYGYVAYYANQVVNAQNGYIVDDFVFYKTDEANTLVAYLGNDDKLILPTNFKGENYIIGNSAFYGCSGLREVTIPNSVTSIDSEAFYGCNGLKTIVSLNTTPPSCTNNSSFANSNYSNATLFVPKNSFAKYFIDDVWGQFSNIKKIETLLSSIKLDNSSIELVKGSTTILSATVAPSDATIKDIVWESSNSNIVKIDQTGKVTALSPGTAIITATAIDGSEVSASCIVLVKAIEAQLLSISQSEANIVVNNTIDLYCTILPENASNKTVTWQTSNSNIASITQNGDNSIKVTGVSPGVATIIATTNDGTNLTAMCKVIVTSGVSILLSQTEAKLSINDIMTLTYTITPSDISVEWSTSDSNIAYIRINSDNSVTVVGVNNGVATITATANDDWRTSASCLITVGTGVSGVESLTDDNNAIEVARYDIHGRLLSEPTKGINIIKKSDGYTRKENIK